MSCEHFRDEPCAEPISHKIITIEENKRKYIGENEHPNTKACKSFVRIKVDDCLIKDQTQIKCDYLLLECISDKEKETGTSAKAYFIELKGGDIDHAVEQIDNTMKLLKDKLENVIYFARIVLSKAPSPNNLSSKYKALERKLIQKQGLISRKYIDYKTDVFPEKLYEI